MHFGKWNIYESDVSVLRGNEYACETGCIALRIARDRLNIE